MATLNSDHDLELAAPPVFGALPSTTDPVFFRLWNGIADIASFTGTAPPVELRDGIRLAFDAPAAGNYRPGDYWTFTVRAGEITSPAVLIDHAPPVGIVYHRVALAEINWTGRHDTRVDGTIEDCRHRFRPLTNQKVCCTLLVGDGITSFGDFNALEQAALHLPAAGDELCLLPACTAPTRPRRRRNVTIHGCPRRTLVLPRTETKVTDHQGRRLRRRKIRQPRPVDHDGTPVMRRRQEGSCRDVRIEGTRMIARVNAIRATNAAELTITGNRLHLLDTVAGRHISGSDDTLVERNTLVLLPFVDRRQTIPRYPTTTRRAIRPTRARRPKRAHPSLVHLTRSRWTFALALLAPKQPYRAIGGIHVRAGSERAPPRKRHSAVPAASRSAATSIPSW